MHYVKQDKQVSVSSVTFCLFYLTTSIPNFSLSVIYLLFTITITTTVNALYM